MKTRLVAIAVVLAMLLANVSTALAGPPEPPAFNELYAQIEQIKIEIAKTPMDGSTRELFRVLLISVESMLEYTLRGVSTSSAVTRVSRILYSLRTVLKEIKGGAPGTGGTSGGVWMITPLFFTCTFYSYPYQGGHVFSCPGGERYWCKGFQCMNMRINQ